MKASYARYMNNPLAAAEVVRRAEQAEAGVPVAPTVAPKAAVALSLTETEPGKWTGQCPACKAEGLDDKGQHLVIFEDGHYGCVLHQGPEGHEHRQNMAELAPELRTGKKRFRAPIVEDQKAAAAAKARAEAIAGLWEAIKGIGCEPEALPGSAQIEDDPRWQFLQWCGLWGPGEVAWVGSRYDSTAAFAAHKFCPADKDQRDRIWEAIVAERLDHASGLVWKEDAVNRRNECVAGRRLIVVEHDHASKAETVGLIRYAADALGWPLKMILSTGGRGIHGIFDASGISPMQLKADATLLADLGADKNALGRSATRIPGALRQPENTNRQNILWLAPTKE